MSTAATTCSDACRCEYIALWRLPTMRPWNACSLVLVGVTVALGCCVRGAQATVVADSTGQALLAWIAANGGVVGDIVIGHDDAASGPHAGRRGVFTTDAIPAPDTVLLKVPLSLLMTTTSGAATSIGEILSYLDHSPTNAISLQLLHAARYSEHPDFSPRDLDKDPTDADPSVSFWRPFLASLPSRDDSSTPLWFNDTEARALKGTTLWRMCRRRLAAAHRSYDHVFTERLLRFEPQGFPSMAPALSDESWLWALSMVCDMRWVVGTCVAAPLTCARTRRCGLAHIQ